MIDLYQQFVGAKCKDGQQILDSLDSNKAHLAHMIFGLVDEVGECSSPLKKFIFYGQELDEENVEEELGDIMFYVTGICNALHLDLEEILRQNMNKLNKRYPDKYTDELAAERLDKNESN